MKKYINHSIILLIASVLAFSGCTDSFDEINTNPDKPQEVPTTNLLAYVLYYTSYRLYDRWFAMDEPMTFCGYAAKMTYIDESRYNYRPGVQDTNWEYLYRILNNVRDIQERSELASNHNMLNVANVMEVHLLQIATDRWRDVPFTEAARINEGILQPTYDKQEEIYPALLAKLKETADSFASGIGTDNLGDGDLLFGGNITKWQKYCNSLRLRMAIRISEVAPELAKTTIEEVLGNPVTYPIMTSNEDNAFFWWISSDPNYYEPMADQYRIRKTEYCSSDVMVNHLLKNNDPRIAVYCTPTPISQLSEGQDGYDPEYPTYKGYTIGAGSNAVANQYSIWGYRYGQDLGGFSPYMRVAEPWFIIAEAATLGWNTGGITAEEAYTKAVTYSLEENEISSDEIAAYLAGSGKFTGEKEQIWYEQWVAMYKQAMEGWSLYRRTGIPAELYPAPGRPANYSDHNVPPFRSPYPDRERNLNKENCAPFDAEVVDNLWGKQMWWDTRTDVY